MPKVHQDPGPLPPGASPKEREQHRKAEERFLTEGGKPGVSNVPATVDPTDRRIAQLQADHRNFMAAKNPLTMALWIALLRPAKDVIHEVEQTRRFERAQKGHEPGGEYVAPSRPAIVEIAQQLVASGIAGDTAAIERIAERIEGRTGVRVGDQDPADKEAEKKSELIVSKLVEKLTRERAAPVVIDVTPEPVSSKNNLDAPVDSSKDR